MSRIGQRGIEGRERCQAQPAVEFRARLIVATVIAPRAHVFATPCGPFATNFRRCDPADGPHFIANAGDVPVARIRRNSSYVRGAPHADTWAVLDWHSGDPADSADPASGESSGPELESRCRCMGGRYPQRRQHERIRVCGGADDSGTCYNGLSRDGCPVFRVESLKGGGASCRERDAVRPMPALMGERADQLQPDSWMQRVSTRTGEEEVLPSTS